MSSRRLLKTKTKDVFKTCSSKRMFAGPSIWKLYLSSSFLFTIKTSWISLEAVISWRVLVAWCCRTWMLVILVTRMDLSRKKALKIHVLGSNLKKSILDTNFYFNICIKSITPKTNKGLELLRPFCYVHV